jgi:CRP/FNR family cyclic AMP-dependent transcriptional regulator
MLKRTQQQYEGRWVAQTEGTFSTVVDPGVVAEHRRYWVSIVRAVEQDDFNELLANARDAGRYQSRMGIDLSEAIRRTIEATNMIEIALLEENDSELPPLNIINELADLRSMIAMAVAEGYKLENAAQESAATESSVRERLRAALQKGRSKYVTTTLATGGEIAPLYDSGMVFHFVETGKLRLFNLLPNGRTITLSILGENDVFLQWKTESSTLSCLCAEAMGDASVISVSQNDLTDLIAAQPAAAIDVIGSFAKRVTESQVLIEDLLNNSVNVRLYRTLLELAKQFGRADGDATLIDVPLTHQRLADMIGSNRVTVTRKLHELAERGIVANRRNATIAVQIEKLVLLAAAGSET